MLPPTAPAAAESVTAALSPAVIEAGEMVPVTPEGKPESESEIESAPPLTTAEVSASVVLPPAGTVTCAGLSANEKSPGCCVDVAVTTSARLALSPDEEGEVAVQVTV